MTIEASAAARSDAEAPLSASQFALVCELVESRAGLDFREARRSLLESSLRARMQQLDLDTLDAYVARLSGADSAVEFDALISTLTITETQFLRDPAQFALLREHILPTLMAQRGATRDRRLRICSAGCSSGEEPYSLALSWREMDPAARHGWALEIVGIDVNVQMLEVARRRLYPARALRNLDAEVTGRYFTAGDCAFEIDAGLAAAVRFEHGSLLDEGTLGSERYDIIVCKNVSIYFSLEMTRRLVERLHTALSPGGYLLLGHSESLWQMENGLELVEHEGVFCYRKPPVLETIACAPDPNVPTLAIDDALERQYAACLARIRDADWPRAESEVASLLSSSDGFVPAQLLMAGIHAHLGRYREASDCATRVLRLNSLEPKAHLLLGMIAARNGRSEDAITALRRALDLDDSLALGYFWLGNLYRDQGNVEGACAEYARAVMRHDRRELDFTEEFAADLRPGQIVDFCRSSLERLRGTW